MRALCGAIITAGAMIGLGLTALAFGIRFANSTATHGPDGQLFGIPTMVTILVVLLLTVLIGLGIAFLGLMYHHMRRHHELQRDLGRSPRAESLGGV
jgi:Na+/melibiose symporter-like transporter